MLVGGLTGSDLPIDEIALYDVDQDRLSTIGGVAARMAAQGRVVLSASLDDCVTGADFVFTSIRVGGLAHRVRDETIALSHGIVGQETVGPAGFAMAARTIPHMVQYARAIARAAPGAWIINFTNPVGMVTEAMRTVTSRVIGICDTPTELFEEVAHALDLQSDRSFFDYFGLNHLGWIREVYSDGVPQLRRLWNDRERLQSLYKVPLFDPAYLRHLELLPTEYVYYYESPKRAVDNMRQAGQTRGQAIAELTDVLFDALRNSKADSVAIYKSYLFARSASYMQIESGAAPAVGAGRGRVAVERLRQDRAFRRARDSFQPQCDRPAERRKPRQHPKPDGSRRRRSAVRGQRQWSHASSRRPGSRSRPATARSSEGIRAADRPRRARAVG